MKIEALVQDAEEGACWAEVPAIPASTIQGNTTVEALVANLREAIKDCLSVYVDSLPSGEGSTEKAAARERPLETINSKLSRR